MHNLSKSIFCNHQRIFFCCEGIYFFCLTLKLSLKDASLIPAFYDGEMYENCSLFKFVTGRKTDVRVNKIMSLVTAY